MERLDKSEPGGGRRVQRGTPAWLDGDLSLRTRQILFGIVLLLSLFSFYLFKTCQPGDLIDEFDTESLCGGLGNGAPYGTPSNRWGLVCLLLLCALCCLPCFSIADHKEWYEAFPALKRARDRYQAMAQAQINAKRRAEGRSELPLHDAQGSHFHRSQPR